jgi:hypothetical protein
VELFHRTPGKTGGVQSAGFNAGGIYDFTDHYDFLLSLEKISSAPIKNARSDAH